MGKLDRSSGTAHRRWRSRRYSRLLGVLAMGFVLSQCTTLGFEPGPGTQSSHDELYERGKHHLSANRLGLALEHFKAAAGRDAGSIAALNAIGTTYDLMRRFDLAKVHYRKALSIEPRSVQTQNNLGYSYFLEGNYRYADAYLREAALIAGDGEVASTILANLALVQETAARAADGGDVSARPAPVVAECRTNGPWIEGPDGGVYTLVTRPTDSAKAAVRELAEHAGRSARLAQSGARAPECATLVRSVFGEVPSLSAAHLARPEPVTLPPPPPVAKPAAMRQTFTLEVSNGAGRSFLAARMRLYLAHHDVRTLRLTNADHFAHERTVVFYRPGHAEHARSISDLLALDVDLRESTSLGTDVRVLLGADVLPFDRILMGLPDDERPADSREGDTI
jgi:tetratricopeptide (TPR) repeat protein